jgi:hypothetical protein
MSFGIAEDRPASVPDEAEGLELPALLGDTSVMDPSGYPGLFPGGGRFSVASALSIMGVIESPVEH